MPTPFLTSVTGKEIVQHGQSTCHNKNSMNGIWRFGLWSLRVVFVTIIAEANAANHA